MSKNKELKIFRILFSAAAAASSAFAWRTSQGCASVRSWVAFVAPAHSTARVFWKAMSKTARFGARLDWPAFSLDAQAQNFNSTVAPACAGAMELSKSQQLRNENHGNSSSGMGRRESSPALRRQVERKGNVKVNRALRRPGRNECILPRCINRQGCRA